jgi:OOP family OmpA-OmpF porin
MCRSRVRRLVPAALAALAIGVAGPAARGQEHPKVLDIRLTVISLDGSVSTTESERQVAVTLAADVLFAFDKASLTARARGRIGEVAARIRKSKARQVRVEGYTDSKGSGAYNLRLSKRRAAAVAGAVRRQLGGGTPPLQARGRGEANPIAPNTKQDGSDNPRGRARNRRVTVVIGR